MGEGVRDAEFAVGGAGDIDRVQPLEGITVVHQAGAPLLPGEGAIEEGEVGEEEMGDLAAGVTMNSTAPPV